MIQKMTSPLARYFEDRPLNLEQYLGEQPPPSTNLVAVLQHWAKVRGDAPAFYFADREGDEDQCLTYAQLDAAARNLGGYLQKLNGAGNASCCCIRR